MEDYTAEMIRDMAFSFCPQCGTAIVPNHKGRPRKFCSPECRSRWNNTHPKPENWKTVRSKICPVCGGEFSYRHQYGLERKYCSRACANKGRWKEGDANGRTTEHTIPKHLCILTTSGATPSTGMATFWSSRRMQMPSC